jgi:hypothetical protein
MATQVRRSESLVDDPGIWFGIAITLVIATFLLAGAAGLHPLATGVAVVAVGGLCAARLNGLVALALGAVVWAFFTGFTENTFGQLTLAPADLERLGAFAVATAAVATLARSLLRKDVGHG